MASKIASSTPTMAQASRRCLCSPTNHPGSFRCSKHKKPPRAVVPRHSNNLWRDPSMAAKSNSLKAILLQMIKSSAAIDHHRRKSFQPKPSRFSLMNNANTPVVEIN